MFLFPTEVPVTLFLVGAAFGGALCLPAHKPETHILPGPNNGEGFMWLSICGSSFLLGRLLEGTQPMQQ